MKEAIKVLTQPITIDNSFSHINEVMLGQIIISESVKAYHTKDVDNANVNQDQDNISELYNQLVFKVIG